MINLELLAILTKGLFGDFSAWLKGMQPQLAAIAATVAITTAALKLYPIVRAKWQVRWNIKHLPHTLGANLYTPQEIHRATRYYVQADCQSVDPSGSENFRQVFGARQNSFKALDHLLFQGSEYRHTLILADAGMGKSSLLINYYARHIRSRSKNRNFNIAIIPLGIPDVQAQINKFSANSANTVLFLDALDEDTNAIADHRKRLAELMQWTTGFRHVLITCRTQFFLSDEEIPKDAGIVRIGIINAGESRSYLLNKLYLSPFSDAQIIEYLKRRFPIWQWKLRERAHEMVTRMGELSARPMLLAHVDELIFSQIEFRFSFQIYEEMVEAWLKREEKFVNKGALREFSELVAVDIYLNREKRQSEKIDYGELLKIANSINPDLASWQESDRSFLTNRSLLNRDAVGNRKFAHRSIMEYLFISRVTKPSNSVGPTNWTDQMKRFWWEMCCHNIKLGIFPTFDKCDLANLENFMLYPMFQVRSRAERVSEQRYGNLIYELIPEPIHRMATKELLQGEISLEEQLANRQNAYRQFPFWLRCPLIDRPAPSPMCDTVTYQYSLGLKWFIVREDYSDIALDKLLQASAMGIVSRESELRLPTLPEIIAIYLAGKIHGRNWRWKYVVTSDDLFGMLTGSKDFDICHWMHMTSIALGSSKSADVDIYPSRTVLLVHEIWPDQGRALRRIRTVHQYGR